MEHILGVSIAIRHAIAQRLSIIKRVDNRIVLITLQRNDSHTANNISNIRTTSRIQKHGPRSTLGYSQHNTTLQEIPNKHITVWRTDANWKYPDIIKTPNY